MDSKKILMEETSGKNYRRFLMEQGTEEENNEPDYVHNLKQGAAKSTMLFINGMMSAIVPALIVGFVLFVLALYLIFK